MALDRTAAALHEAELDGRLPPEHIRAAIERRQRWAEWGRPTPGREPTLDDVMWARRAADRSVHVVRGSAPRLGSAVEVVVVDDDVGGPWESPQRGEFERTLRALEVDAALVPEPTAHTRVPVLIALYADVIAWKGRSALSDDAVSAVARVVAHATVQHRASSVILFSHPRSAAALEAANIVCAWGGEPPMQAAAARALVRGVAADG